VPGGPKVGLRYSAAFLRRSATAGPAPHTLNLDRHISFSKLSNQPETSLLLFTDIKNALVWCHVAQKKVCGTLQYSSGGVPKRDRPYIHSQCPDTSPFLELSNQAERSLLIIHWYQECPSLVPFGPKVGRRWSAAFLRRSATTGSIPHPPNLPRNLSFFRIVKPARKITFYYSLISRMPYFGAMWSKSRYAVLCSIPKGGVQPRDQPHIHLQCPNSTPFSELSNQPERSLLILHWYQECPSLVPCGPKVGRW